MIQPNGVGMNKERMHVIAIKTYECAAAPDEGHWDHGMDADKMEADKNYNQNIKD